MNTPLHTSSTDRRRFLATSLSAAGSALLSSCESPGGGKSRYIDAHVHVWTSDTKRYPISKDPKFAAHRTVNSFTPEELFTHSKPQGVDRIVLIQMSFYEYDNSYMLDMMEQHDDVFSGVAIVDENKADVAATMKSLAKRDVRGFRIYTSAEQAAKWSDGMKKMCPRCTSGASSIQRRASSSITSRASA
jgi:predicted TIM-barrel fold metal-dependent hydrolase